MTTTYILKSARGTPVMSFDNEVIARDYQRLRKAKGINMRLFEQKIIENEITNDA